MAGILELCAKRRRYPVELEDGETVYVRSLLHEEIETVRTIGDELSLPFVIGKCLVDLSGQPALPQANSDELPKDWAARVAAIIKQWPADTTMQLRMSITKVTLEPSREKLEKKS